ncbi:MAG: DUF2190 family protein [Bilophila sp.]|nr:DUF2190 family protein [Bilophila sp.]
MKNFIQDGSRMRWKNNGSAAVSSGALVSLPGMVGVAAADIPVGAEGELAACGVFLLAKEAAASGKEVAQGAAVYLDADGKLTTAATATSGSDITDNRRVGVCWEAAPPTAASVNVKINV